MGSTSKLSIAVNGMVAGAAATVAMSVLMMLSKKAGIQGEHPPKKITQAALASARLPAPTTRQLNLASSLTHIGFGAASGALFALAQPAFGLRKSCPWTGMLFAAGIWLMSYRGWVPALRIMPSAEDDRPGRVGTMFAAHLVYGATLSALLPRLRAARALQGSQMSL